MKKDIHVSIADEVLADLNQMSDKLKIARSKLLEGIIVKGIQDIVKLNYNFAEFLKK